MNAADKVETPAKPANNERGRAKERVGIVVAANAAKTVVVSVERRTQDQQYGKYMQRRKKYQVHDLVGCAVGDHVRIRETRPISKTKHWRVVEKIGRDRVAATPMVD